MLAAMAVAVIEQANNIGILCEFYHQQPLAKMGARW